MPTLSGVAHVALTVTDLPRSRQFWSEVLCMPVLTGSETYCALLTGSPTPAPIILTCHDQVDDGRFSEFTVGLDHVCLTVDNVEVLTAWKDHLDEHDVPYSFRRSEWGHHMNLRDPDNIAVELFVLEPDAEGHTILDAITPAS